MPHSSMLAGLGACFAQLSALQASELVPSVQGAKPAPLVVRDAWWDRFERVPFGSGSAWTWSTGAELRIRGESLANEAGVDAPEGDRDYVWYRALPSFEVRHEGGLRAFLELVFAFETGDEAGASPVDEDRADLLQGFIDVPIASGAVLRGGRQVLALGSERLISARYGPNVPRAFDAATCVVERGAWRLDALWARPVENELGAFDDESDASRALWTLYATQSFGADQGLDLYYIGLAEDEAVYEQGAGEHERHTLGARAFGRSGGWDWNFELMAQAGRFAGADVRAGSFASDTGVVLSALPFDPRLGLKADFISGDRDASDPSLETFDPLFPKGKYFGEAGLIGPYNLIDLHPSLDLALAAEWSLGFASVLYWRESTQDGIYGPAGDLIRSAQGSDERFAGTQLDVALEYAPSPWLDASLGYSALLPGDFLRATGSSETMHFVGIELRLRF